MWILLLKSFCFFVIYRLEYPSCKGFYFIYFLLWDDKKIIQDSRAEHKYSIRIGNVIYLMFTHYVDFHNSKPSTLYHMPSSIHKVNKQRKLNKQGSLLDWKYDPPRPKWGKRLKQIQSEYKKHPQPLAYFFCIFTNASCLSISGALFRYAYNLLRWYDHVMFFLLSKVIKKWVTEGVFWHNEEFLRKWIVVDFIQHQCHYFTYELKLSLLIY